MRLLIRLAVAVPMSVSALVITPAPSEAGQPVPGSTAALPVVASNTVLADFVENVGGEKAQVRPLAPRGADPHTFQPTPESMKVLSQARVIFFNGGGLEEWWQKAMRSVKRTGVPVIELSKGLVTLTLPGESRGHAAEPDPHVWLDPILAKTYVQRIREALTTVDPGNAAYYAERATAYAGQLDALDAWIRAEVAQVPAAHRKLVTFHDAFQYFARRYGLTVRRATSWPAPARSPRPRPWPTSSGGSSRSRSPPSSPRRTTIPSSWRCSGGMPASRWSRISTTTASPTGRRPTATST